MITAFKRLLKEAPKEIRNHYFLFTTKFQSLAKKSSVEIGQNLQPPLPTALAHILAFLPFFKTCPVPQSICLSCLL